MQGALPPGIAAVQALPVAVDDPIHLAGSTLGVHSRGADVSAAGTGDRNLLRPVLKHCADGMVMAPCGAVGYEDTAASTAGWYSTTSSCPAALQESPKDPDESKQAREADASGTPGTSATTTQDVVVPDTSINAYPDPAVAPAEAHAGARGKGAGGRTLRIPQVPREASLGSLLEAVYTPTSFEARKKAAEKALAELVRRRAQHELEKEQLRSQVEEGRTKCAALQARIDNGAGLSHEELEDLRRELDSEKQKTRLAEREAQDKAAAADLATAQLSDAQEVLRDLRVRHDDLGIEIHALLEQAQRQQPAPE